MSGWHRNGPYQRLLAALAPNPTRWEWRGESYEAAYYGQYSCACGHPIRRLHPIYCRVTGRLMVIGGVCLEAHFMTASRAPYGQLSLTINVPRVSIELDREAMWISRKTRPRSLPSEWTQLGFRFEI